MIWFTDDLGGDVDLWSYSHVWFYGGNHQHLSHTEIEIKKKTIEGYCLTMPIIHFILYHLRKAAPSLLRILYNDSKFYHLVSMYRVKLQMVYQ